MRYVPLFLPFLLAYLLQDTPASSYWVAWTGSIFILWVTLTGRIKALPEERPLVFQLFRPIVFAQLVFAGYTCLTSVFYFLSVSETAVGIAGWVAPELALVAEAQRYYLLGHASVTTGMLIAMNYSDSGKYRVVSQLAANRMLLGISTGFFVLYLLFGLMPGWSQLSYRFRDIAIVASIFSFSLSIIHRESTHIWLNAAVFGGNFAVALLGGWKEDVLVLLMLFFAALFPYYRRITAITAAIAFALFVFIMPAFTAVYRSMAWYGKVAPSVAIKLSWDEIISGRANLSTKTQEFARGRLSEIGLFTLYLKQVPENRPHYGAQIVSQAALNLVPRLLWPGKPSTETLVMERVFENQIYSRISVISAKPQFVVDGYLSGGASAIFAACLAYGVLASLISRLTERWFGGYTLGSGLVFGSLFQIFWRGNSFEFFFGTVFWSFILMVCLFQLGTRLKFLVPARVRLRPQAAPPPPKSRAPRWAERLNTQQLLGNDDRGAQS